ncbi:MAG: hypothetical protein AB9866_28650 [Syntrophobacteraceae bacterium]
MTGYIGAYQYDEQLGYRLKPSIHLLRTYDHQQEVYTNSIGTVNFQDTFSNYDSLIFAIGDSYTQGTGLSSDAGYPFQLDLMLNFRDDIYLPRFAVVNLGLAAFGTGQEIISMLMYKEILGNPKYVLYLGCSNDYEDDNLFRDGSRHKHLVDGNPGYGAISLRCLQWLTNETEIGKRSKLAFATLRKRYSSRDIRQQPAQLPQNQANICIAHLLEPQLNRLLLVSKDSGSRLIVSWADEPGSPSRSYEWLQQWALQNDVAFADWHSGVESVQRNISKLPLHNPHSGGHYRSWVNNLIAKAFAKHITDQ